MRPMFAMVCDRCYFFNFYLPSSLEQELPARLGAQADCNVSGTRQLSRDMKLNDALRMEVDPETYEVRQWWITNLQKAAVLPLAQRYFLF